MRVLLLFLLGIFSLNAQSLCPQPRVNPENYKLSFMDEFHKFSWIGDVGGGTWKTWLFTGGDNYKDDSARTNSYNKEWEYYSDPGTPFPNPFEIHDSQLWIKAAPYQGLPVVDGLQLKYTSGMITTEESFNQTYGYFEINTELPWGEGFWPAFWMLGYDPKGEHFWPIEIDVLEAFGGVNSKGEGNNTEYHWNYHYINESDSGPGQWKDIGMNITSGFHSYGTLWTKDAICFYFDNMYIAEGKTPDELNTPMYLLANLAVGASWPGYPDPTTPFPSYMKIDWIRAYKLP
jgi:beta-glucanase (GH16 family)